MGKFVKFVGSRVPPLRVHVVIDNQQIDSRGYAAGKGTVLYLTDAEADVLLGTTPPVIREDGKIVTGFYVDGNLGEAGLTGEKWELVQALAETLQEPAPAPTKSKKAATQAA